MLWWEEYGGDHDTLKSAFSPSRPHFVFGLLFILGLLITLLEISLIGYAYQKMGVHWQYVFALLLLSLLGRYLNIPVAELPAEQVVSGQEVSFFGMRYVIPLVEEWPGTIIALNVGGAVVPMLLSLYLLMKIGMDGRALVGVAIVATIVHWLAYTIHEVGIAVPVFTPPIVAAATALLLSRQSVPSLAYIC